MKDKFNPAAIGALMSGDIDNFMVASTPGGIEAQEKKGQEDLVKEFNRLPIQGMKEYAEVLERLGFMFGGVVDEIFVEVTPPAGWKVVATDHAMHSDIVDDKGRIRGSMFYKAAFYDRSASFHLFSRYIISEDYYRDGDDRDKWTATPFILDREIGSKVLEGEAVGWKDFAKSLQSTNALKTKLAEMFPDHNSVDAYWS